jgi:hypothetical protein
VLLEPVDDDLEFCYRIIEDGDDTQIANAHCTGGRRFYNGAQASLKNFMSYFMKKIEARGPLALDQILQDVFWGWEEYLTHVKTQAMSVKGSIYLIANVVDKKSLPVDGPQLLF